MEHSVYKRIFLLGIAICLNACGRTDCSQIVDLTEKDWCYYEIASASAARDDLHGAMGAIQIIQDVTVRAAATDKLIMSGPTGLTSQGAGDICQTLPEPQSNNCIRTWSRPHLWGE
jgi:hypothetical protein